jgi:pentatricopeptide repeat protein
MPMSISSFNIAVQALAREKQWRKAVKMVQYMEKQA